MAFFSGRNYMAFKKVKKKDSFAQWFIDEFGIDKFNNVIIHEKNIQNGIDIWSLPKRSTAEAWFQCENKEYHQYCISLDKYYRGNRCKYCGRTKYVHPLDSFGQYIIDNYGDEFLNEIWSNKNKISPFKYTIGSEQKAHFNCSECCNYMGTSQIKNYIASKKLCDKCVGNTSSLHNKVVNYLLSIDCKLKYEHDCTITPINPVTKYPLPYDIEVENYKLIIEVNGKQHYKELGKTSKWLHGMSSVEYLAKRKKYDEYKKSFALSNGFFYLEIPYWSEKDEQYKVLINEKIKEISHNMRTTTETMGGYLG